MIYSHTLTLSHSQTLSHTHTHTPSLSLSHPSLLHFLNIVQHHLESRDADEKSLSSSKLLMDHTERCSDARTDSRKDMHAVNAAADEVRKGKMAMWQDANKEWSSRARRDSVFWLPCFCRGRCSCEERETHHSVDEPPFRHGSPREEECVQNCPGAVARCHASIRLGEESDKAIAVELLAVLLYRRP
jgi:hypothetical protein